MCKSPCGEQVTFPNLNFFILFIFLMKTNINSDIFTGVINYLVEKALNDNFHL